MPCSPQILVPIGSVLGGTLVAPVPVVDAVRGLVPFGILVAVVVAWTGPWSPLPSYVPFAPAVTAISSLDEHASSTAFKWHRSWPAPRSSSPGF